MTRDGILEMIKEELIELALKRHELIQHLQAEVEVLRQKVEKGSKPPTNSGNSSQPP